MPRSANVWSKKPGAVQWWHPYWHLEILMYCRFTRSVEREWTLSRNFLWPLLTTTFPAGLGLTPADVLTKPNIRRLTIGKGTSSKIYYPDYIVVIAGLPVLVIEAKAPRQDLESALTEARLYGNELNAFYSTGINPCVRVVVCNGLELWSSPIDSAEADSRLKHGELTSAHTRFRRFCGHGVPRSTTGAC